jgi:hypothetical protein
MAALQDKTLSNDSPSSNFRKSAILGPAQLIDYRKQQRSLFAEISSLQKLTQKILTVFTTGNGRHLLAFRTKLH